MTSNLVEKLKRLNNTAIEIMVLTAPWIMPLPSAVLTAHSFIRHLGFVARFENTTSNRTIDFLIGMVVGLAIECIAILAVSLLERYQSWNKKVLTEKGNLREKYKDIGTVSLKIPIRLLIGYLFISLFFLLLLEIFPSISTFALLLLPFIGLGGGFLLILHNAQNERESVDNVQNETHVTPNKLPKKHDNLQPAKSAQPAEVAENMPKDANKLLEVAENTPQPAEVANNAHKVSDYRLLTKDEKRLIAGMETEQIILEYPIKTRTASGWRTKALLETREN